jgi:hypothetical protein
MSGVVCDGWDAWYNRMPGIHDAELHVFGTCHLPSSNIEVSLELADPGVASEPEVVALRLRLSEPDFGDDLMTDREVKWNQDVGPDVKRVRIVGDAEASIEVRIAV